MKKEDVSIILKPLVKSGVYKNEEVALKDIVVNHIEKKIYKYENTIKEIENKYNMEFNELTENIKHDANFEEEDDWMEIKAAITMKEAWEKAKKDLIGDKSHV